tara:strand:+ start:7394 stop:8056 length:663 start_codon:yes stop_codon:yes gene_type:complete
MGAMTRLDAVNQCLLAAGEAIVSDLENQTGIDTSIAEYLLNQYTDDFQFRGLANNRYTKTLTIDPVTFKVALPMTIISLDFNTALYNEDSQLVRVSVRKEGSAFVLWNVTDQTTNFSAYTEELSATLIVSVEWEDIDTPGQRAIVASAARRYQMLTQGDASMDQYLAQDEMIYNMKGKSRDIESKRRTIWDSASPQTKRAVFRQSGSTAPDFRRWRGRIN